MTTDDLKAYVAAYLATNGSSSWDPATVDAAMAAELRQQRLVCTVPFVHTVAVVTTADSAVVTAPTPWTATPWAAPWDPWQPRPRAFNDYDIGAGVTGAGIPDDTVIVSVDNHCQVTLSAAATATATAVSLVVDPDVSDLAEALARRVATNLANRNLPLGVQTQVAEFGSTATRVGGRDREVTRLEGPYRIVPAG